MADEKIEDGETPFSEAFASAAQGDTQGSTEPEVIDPALDAEAASSEVDQSANKAAEDDGTLSADPEPQQSASVDHDAKAANQPSAEDGPTAESVAEDIATLAAEKKKLTNDVNSMRGRKTSLEHALSEMETATTPNDDDADSPVTGVFKSTEFNEIRELYPDLAESLEKSFGPAMLKIAEENDHLKRELGLLSNDRNTDRAQAEHQIVLDVFPDYEDITKTESFADWYAQSPPYVRAAVEKNGTTITNGSDVVTILENYRTWAKQQGVGTPEPEPSVDKTDPKEIERRRKARSDAADGPSSNNGAPANDRVPDDFSSAFHARASK